VNVCVYITFDTQNKTRRSYCDSVTQTHT